MQHYCSKYKNPAFLSFRRTYRAFLSDGNYKEPAHLLHLLHLDSTDGDRRVFVFQLRGLADVEQQIVLCALCRTADSITYNNV